MKQSALLFALLLLGVPLFCDVIQLKSGRQIQCESVVDEASQVQCIIGRSTIAFPKTQVEKVSKSSAVPKPQLSPAPRATPPVHNPADEAKRMGAALNYTRAGMARMKQKQFQSAIESFQDAYDAYRNKDTVTNLAIAYYYNSKYDSAQSYFQELLTIHPEDVLALNALGIISAIKGDAASADNYWRQSYALKADPVILSYLQQLSQPQIATSSGGRMSLNRTEMEKTISGYEEDSESHFHIRYDGGSVNPELLRDITRTLEDHYDKLRFEFEAEPSNTLEVILYPKKEFLSITGAPDWAGGFNDGRIHLPVGGVDSVNSEVTRVIVHELTHSFFLAKTNGNGPVWLQEGIAEYMDGTRLGPSVNSSFAKLLTSDSFPSLHQMSSSFMSEGASQATLYYAASLSFVQFLMDRYRFYEVNELLRKLGGGESTEEAARQALGSPLPDLEQEWHEQLR